MESDDFVSEDVRSSLERRGYLRRPREVIRDQIIRHPASGVISALPRSLVEFDEAQCRLINRRAARSTAAGEVVQNGTNMAVGPSVPAQGDGAACLYVDVGLARRGALVADDVCGTIAGGGHEAVVEVGGRPTWNRWYRVGIHIGRVPAAVGDAVRLDAANVAVAMDRAGQDGEREGGGGGECWCHICLLYEDSKCLLWSCGRRVSRAYECEQREAYKTWQAFLYSPLIPHTSLRDLARQNP